MPFRDWNDAIAHMFRASLELVIQPFQYDTDSTVLTLYGGAGFTAELTAAAAADDKILLVDLARLYT